MKLSAEDEARILDTAEYVEAALVVLSEKRALDEATYRDDRQERAIVEREFQTAIEACIDIAGILIAASDEPMPETNAGRFATLEELGLLSSETSDRMRSAAGFRNVLAHNYGIDIDDGVVYRHLQDELRWFVEFLREVRAVLDDESIGDR